MTISKKRITIIILGCCMAVAAAAQDQQVLDSLRTIDGKWRIDDNNNVYVQRIVDFE